MRMGYRAERLREARFENGADAILVATKAKSALVEGCQQVCLSNMHVRWTAES